MEKQKLSKKIYAWKYKFIRKKRSKYRFNGHAPTRYANIWWREHRAKEKNEISRFLKGVDECELHFPYHHKHQAGWFYW